MKITTIDEAKLLVGQIFGRGDLLRVVTRVENLGISTYGTVIGDVYWKRPGGEERSRPVWLPNFLKWARTADKTELLTVAEVETVLANFTEEQEVKGTWCEKTGELRLQVTRT